MSCLRITKCIIFKRDHTKKLHITSIVSFLLLSFRTNEDQLGEWILLESQAHHQDWSCRNTETLMFRVIIFLTINNFNKFIDWYLERILSICRNILCFSFQEDANRSSIVTFETFKEVNFHKLIYWNILTEQRNPAYLVNAGFTGLQFTCRNKAIYSRN